jgi:hypothetical protein
VIVSDDGSEYVTVALDSGETVTGTLASKGGRNRTASPSQIATAYF